MKRTGLYSRLAVQLTVGIAALAFCSAAGTANANKIKHSHGRSATSKVKGSHLIVRYAEEVVAVPSGFHEGGYIARCRRGYTAIAGGYIAEGPHLTVVASNPYNERGDLSHYLPNAWFVGVTNTGPTSELLVIMAVCAKGATFVRV